MKFKLKEVWSYMNGIPHAFDKVKAEKPTLVNLNTVSGYRFKHVCIMGTLGRSKPSTETSDYKANRVSEFDRQLNERQQQLLKDALHVSQEYENLLEDISNADNIRYDDIFATKSMDNANALQMKSTHVDKFENTPNMYDTCKSNGTLYADMQKAMIEIIRPTDETKVTMDFEGK